MQKKKKLNKGTNMQMKLTTIFLFIAMSFSVLYAQNAKSDEAIDGPLIQFDQERYNFDQIIEGKVVEHVFKFSNIGNDTLRIKKVDGG